MSKKLTSTQPPPRPHAHASCPAALNVLCARGSTAAGALACPPACRPPRKGWGWGWGRGRGREGGLWGRWQCALCPQHPAAAAQQVRTRLRRLLRRRGRCGRRLLLVHVLLLVLRKRGVCSVRLLPLLLRLQQRQLGAGGGAAEQEGAAEGRGRAHEQVSGCVGWAAGRGRAHERVSGCEGRAAGRGRAHEQVSRRTRAWTQQGSI